MTAPNPQDIARAMELVCGAWADELKQFGMFDATITALDAKVRASVEQVLYEDDGFSAGTP